MKRMKQLICNLSNKSPFSSVLVKVAVCFVLMGLAYRLFFSSFVQFSPVVVTQTDLDVEKTLPMPPSASESESPVSSDLLLANVENTNSQIVAAKCNLFIGDWAPDPSDPSYTNSTCKFIEYHQNCMRNGRPDTDYIYWRWKPRDCNVPKFDPENFLGLMRNKSFAFIGDSVMRNYVQSLLCTLSKAEEAIEVYHDEQGKSRRWYFPSHQFNLSLLWSPLLTEATVFEDDNGVSSGIIQLHLDELDTVWTDQFNNYDYILIAGGKWFLKNAIYYENNAIVGCHNCQGKNITEVGFEFAYRKAQNTTLKYIVNSEHKVHTFFRTITPDHFENGFWNTGGYCNRTKPFEEGKVDMNVADQILHRVEVEEFESALAIGSEKGLILKLFDTTRLSFLRPDGHPGPYLNFHPYDGIDKNAKVQNDCLHWCLPGPLDSGNDLMLEMLLST